MKEERKRVYPLIDAKLYDRVKKIAKKEKRTVSRQIECFFEDCLDKYLTEKEATHA